MLKYIYAAFNMLLRENMARGGLKQWEMTESDRVTCRCENQLTKPDCSSHIVMESQAVTDNDEASGHKSPYYCDRKWSEVLWVDTRAYDHRHTSHVLPHRRFPSP
jgi:hypothetical protein